MTEGEFGRTAEEARRLKGATVVDGERLPDGQLRVTLDLVDRSRIVGTLTGQDEEALHFSGIPVLRDVEQLDQPG